MTDVATCFDGGCSTQKEEAGLPARPARHSILSVQGGFDLKPRRGDFATCVWTFVSHLLSLTERTFQGERSCSLFSGSHAGSGPLGLWNRSRLGLLLCRCEAFGRLVIVQRRRIPRS